MKISLYTFARNALYWDYHIIDMLKHHLPFADEIIVNEGYSTDGTYEAIKDIHPKIKIFRSHWDDSDPKKFWIQFKNEACKRCTGDWCILLDCDEFIPDRNYHNIEVWGNGANVRIVGKKLKPFEKYDGPWFMVHHFGMVRNPARLREKWHWQSRFYLKTIKNRIKIPKFLFRLFPHRWDDPQFLDNLEIYKGPYIKAVRENPKGFVRDNLYHLLKNLKRRRSK